MSNTPETPIQILQNGQARFVLAIEEILKSRGLEVVRSVRSLIIEISELKRDRDEIAELHLKAIREREASERKSDAMLERALRAERERDNLQEIIRGEWPEDQAEELIRHAKEAAK